MPREAPSGLDVRCQPIQLLVSDVDGVMTNGVIALDDAGSETKNFHVRDGMGFKLWHRAGKKTAILSGRCSAALEHRAAELKITHVLQGHEHKVPPLRALIAEIGLAPRQVCFIGDDLADLPVLLDVGLAVCPADAVAEVKDVAHLITRAAGGEGVIREAVEVILKAQGSWIGLIAAVVASS